MFFSEKLLRHPLNASPNACQPHTHTKFISIDFTFILIVSIDLLLYADIWGRARERDYHGQIEGVSLPPAPRHTIWEKQKNVSNAYYVWVLFAVSFVVLFSDVATHSSIHHQHFIYVLHRLTDWNSKLKFFFNRIYVSHTGAKLLTWNLFTPYSVHIYKWTLLRRNNRQPCGSGY